MGNVSVNDDQENQSRFQDISDSKNECHFIAKDDKNGANGIIIFANLPLSYLRKVLWQHIAKKLPTSYRKALWAILKTEWNEMYERNWCLKYNCNFSVNCKDFLFQFLVKLITISKIPCNKCHLMDSLKNLKKFIWTRMKLSKS